MALDHLVFAARSLDEGVAWCETTFGITPSLGGQHPLMGTHNRLFSIASPTFPRAYVELIAVDPQAPAPTRPRWFDLDAAQMRAALREGPQLVHWVARASDIHAQLAALRTLGLDGGEVLAAERETPRGLLRWHIGVRPDGQRLCSGALPTWIAWGDIHPTDALPTSGVSLQSLALSQIPDAALAQFTLPSGITGNSAPGMPALHATLTSPRGCVELRSRC
ncbi:MAG: VOC family protein [Cytophagales bacterium]|nr:VOC family protein [Rhizobacter sp.]